jgi:hypothetical protein
MYGVEGNGLQGKCVGLLEMLSYSGGSFNGIEMQIPEWVEGFAKGGLQYADNAEMYLLKGFYERSFLSTHSHGVSRVCPLGGHPKGKPYSDYVSAISSCELRSATYDGSCDENFVLSVIIS